MSLLFTPYDINSIRLKNRIVMSPMCMYSAVDGIPNKWHEQHYVTRAVGGVGLIIMEATAVSPEGRISYADLGLWNDEQMLAFKGIVKQIKEQGTVAGIQLAHAGRKASCEVSWKKGRQIQEGENSWKTLAPSAIPYHDTDSLPHELSKEEIDQIKDEFKRAASRALDAGFQMIEIHAAHGYLIHEFYSPFSNQRTDEYGGSFENRIRFLLEVLEAIQEVWPKELPIFVRISATDWIEERGWQLEDSIALAKILKEKGVALVDCSTGANVPGVKIPVAPNYQVPFATAIRQQAGIPTGAVGLITGAHQAEAILQNGEADLIVLGRELLRNPYFPLLAAQELGAVQDWPLQYERARPIL
ncbi:MAG TPA: NADPH dehydrogenase NamA [Edaphocola sp.]|nr:NADPH dehydrogenase NamA [Edaphocola sp.]